MKITKILIILSAVIILILPALTLAQITPGLIDNAAGGAGYPAASGGPSSIPQTVGRLISLVLSFVGALFFIYIVVAGIEWMTAGGAEDKVSKAKTKITNAVVGLAITVAAYFITWFISNVLGAA